MPGGVAAAEASTDDSESVASPDDDPVDEPPEDELLLPDEPLEVPPDAPPEEPEDEDEDEADCGFSVLRVPRVLSGCKVCVPEPPELLDDAPPEDEPLAPPPEEPPLGAPPELPLGRLASPSAAAAAAAISSDVAPAIEGTGLMVRSRVRQPWRVCPTSAAGQLGAGVGGLAPGRVFPR